MVKGRMKISVVLSPCVKMFFLGIVYVCTGRPPTQLAGEPHSGGNIGGSTIQTVIDRRDGGAAAGSWGSVG
jgi:hypothetical protein